MPGSDELTEWDIKLLRIANGETVPEVTGWGSWMTPCIEYLSGRRLICAELENGTYNYKITDAGRAALLKENKDG